MSSEWMKVMLDEIARKQAAAEQERLEFERRRVEREAAAAAGATAGPEAPTELEKDPAPDPKA
jgi:hypothetical protein